MQVQSLGWEDPTENALKGNPLQHSGDPMENPMENPMDRGAWWATVHRVTVLDTTEATQANDI